MATGAVSAPLDRPIRPAQPFPMPFPSPLQNRVRPDGAILAHPSRGLRMGNRGGPLHDAEGRLVRRQASTRWICCLPSFRGRRRGPLGARPGKTYSALFFLDDATALAAGHRPCFECRRAEARAFAEALAAARGGPAPGAAAMDRALAAARAGPRPRGIASHLPPGAMVRDPAGRILLRGAEALHPWDWTGYGPPEPLRAAGSVEVLTPLPALDALRGGWDCMVHPTVHPAASPGTR